MAVGVVLDGGVMLFGIRGGLALVQLRHGVLQHFRMAHQIFAHDLLDLAALIGSESIARERCAARPSRQGDAAQAAAVQAQASMSSVISSLVIGRMHHHRVACVRHLHVGDVVGLHPAGRPDREAVLGAGRELRGGLDSRRASKAAARRPGRHGRCRPCGHRPWRAGCKPRAIPARAPARIRSTDTASSRWAGSLLSTSAWPSMTWISAGLGASWTARRSGAMASAGLPPSSSA